MPRLGGYYLDKSPTSTVAVCRVCGARYAALSTTSARHLVAGHVTLMHHH